MRAPPTRRAGRGAIARPWPLGARIRTTTASVSPAQKNSVNSMTLTASPLFAQTSARVQTFLLRDASGLIAPKVKAEAVKYLDRECIRINVEGEDSAGLALLPGPARGT